MKENRGKLKQFDEKNLERSYSRITVHSSIMSEWAGVGVAIGKEGLMAWEQEGVGYLILKFVCMDKVDGNGQGS